MHKSAERMRSIDGLRGIAVLAILVFHYFSSSTIQETSTHWHSIIQNLLIGIEIFFCVSGFLCFYSISQRAKVSQNPGTGFLISRFFRIFPLYWIIIIMQGFLWTAPISLVFKNAFFLPYFIPSFSRSKLVSCSWSLAPEIIFYASVPLLFHKLKNKIEILFLCIVFSCIALTWARNAPYLVIADDGMFIGRYFLNFLQFFCLGWLVAMIFESFSFQKVIQDVQNSNSKWIALAIFALIFMFPAFGSSLSKEVSVTMLLVLAKLNYPSLKIIFESKSLVWLGKRCYGVYFWHFLFAFHWFQNQKQYLKETFSISEFLIQPVWLLVAIIPILVITELSWRLLEKPCISFGKKVELRFNVSL